MSGANSRARLRIDPVGLNANVEGWLGHLSISGSGGGADMAAPWLSGR